MKKHLLIATQTLVYILSLAVCVVAFLLFPKINPWILSVYDNALLTRLNFLVFIVPIFISGVVAYVFSHFANFIISKFSFIKKIGMIPYDSKKFAMRLVLVFLAVAVPVSFAYSSWSVMGSGFFADTTEYGIALARLGKVFIALDIVVAGYFFYKTLIAREKKDFITIVKLISFYILLRFSLIFCVDWYLKSHLGLDFGHGG